MRIKSTALAVLVSGAAVGLAPLAQAGVVPVAGSASVDLTVNAGTDHYDQSRSSDSAAGANLSLTHDHTDAFFGYHGKGESTVITDFDTSHPGQILGTGHLYIDAFAGTVARDPNAPNPEQDGYIGAMGHGNFKFTFEVTDHDEPLLISGTVYGNADSQTYPSHGDPTLLLDGQIVKDSGIDPTDPSTLDPNFSKSYSLSPGTHTLSGTGYAGSSGPGSGHDAQNFYEESNTLDFNFTLGTPSATAIPLPAGVWTGACGLLAAAGVVGIRKRRRLVI
jgi:hypothetical protein